MLSDRTPSASCVPLSDRLLKLAKVSFFSAVATLPISIAMGELFLGLTGLLFFFQRTVARKRPAWPSTAWGALAFIGVAVLSCLVQEQLPRGWEGLTRPLWLLLVPLTANILDSKPARGRFVRTFTMGCAVLALYTLIKNPIDAYRAWHTPGTVFPTYRAALIDAGSMTRGQILMLGLVVTLTLLFQARTGKARSACWGILILQTAAWVLNFKRGSWFCGVFLVFLLLLWERRWFSIGVLLLITAITAALPPVRNRLSELRAELNIARGGRIVMWTQVLPELVRESPWLGIGYKQLTNEKMQQAAARAQNRRRGTGGTERAGDTRRGRTFVERGRNHLHANIAQVLAETGTIGLAVYLAWMAHLLYTSLRAVQAASPDDPESRRMARVWVLFLLGLFGNGLVEYNFGDTELLIVLSMTAGALAPMPQACAESTPSRPHMP